MYTHSVSNSETANYVRIILCDSTINIDQQTAQNHTM